MSPSAARSRRPSLRDALRIAPGSKVRLETVDANATHGRTKARATDQLQKGLDRLTDLQDRLWAESKHPVLIVLQGIDGRARTARSGTS